MINQGLGVLQEHDSQETVIAFLSHPSSYGRGVERVDQIETHISLVFLAGDHAYKLKRGVKFPYLDFSTKERRRRACEAELQLNRRTAPNLYLEVRAVSQTGDGRIGWGEVDQVLDWVVVMRRFDQDHLFDSLARAGALGSPVILDLVDHVVGFHAEAERSFEFGGSAGISAVEQENTRCLNETVGRIFALEHITDLHARSVERLKTISGLLDARRAAGKVRRCHGDLHLRNICLLDGKPVLFDCIEFSDEFATIDVLYDFAFLLMDLEHRRCGDFANQAFNRYIDLTDEDSALVALPLYISLRAAVRAHVTAAAALAVGSAKGLRQEIEEARSFLHLAREVLKVQPAQLIAIGGLSGTGKSTVARSLAPMLGARPGARLLRSDVIRKCLWGVMPEIALPAEAYQPSASRSVYDVLRSKARAALQAGYCVVIDAVSLSETDRRSFEAIANDAQVPFRGIWLQTTPDILKARVSTRHRDASDASIDVLEHQLQSDPGPVDWERLNAGGDRDACLGAVLTLLSTGNNNSVQIRAGREP